MKKLISAFVMMFLCSISYAESMKFITVLSSPVGTFNKLEAVDPAQPAKGNTVNFCTNIGTQGVVELKGTKPAALSTVVLSKNTTLGKTDEGKFSLNNITLKQGGSIKGGRLFGNTVTVNNAASGKANNLYGNQLTVAGAKTAELTVGNKGTSSYSHIKTDPNQKPAEMVWSNEYQGDAACGNQATCAKQYLLKEKGGNLCTQTGYFMSHISQCCQTSRTKLTDYFVQYPGADSSSHTNRCSAEGNYGAYSCTTNDYVNNKVCNEYLMDTSSGSGNISFPRSVSETFSGRWDPVQKWAEKSSLPGYTTTCPGIDFGNLNLNSSSGYPSRLPDADAYCKQYYSGGPVNSAGERMLCKIITSQTMSSIARPDERASYYETTLYCKYESSSNTDTYPTSSYHVTVNQVSCCPR